MVGKSARLVLLVAACGLLAGVPALAQDWGPLAQKALDEMAPADRKNALELLTACAPLYEQGIDARRAESAQGAQMPDRAMQSEQGNHYVATFGSGWDLQSLKNSLAAQNEDIRKGVLSNGWVMTPADFVTKRSTICLTSKRIEQIEGVTTSSVAAVGIGPETTKRLAQMSAADRRDNVDMLQKCSQALTKLGQTAKPDSKYAHLPENFLPDSWAAQLLPFMKDATVAQIQNAAQAHQAEIGVVWTHPIDLAREHAWMCMADVRIGQLGGQPTGAASAGVTPAPSSAATPPAVQRSPEEMMRLAAEQQRQDAVRQLGKPTADALNELLRPGAPAATSPRPPIDYNATYSGEPATEQSRADRKVAQQDYAKSKQRKVHNSENDATSCIKIAQTGVRREWGIEGHFRLTNTCSYPISASWCSTTEECEGGRGNLWKIAPGSSWPVYGADPNFPDIRVGGCKEGDAKKPLRSDAELARSGFSEAHQQPIPTPGVSAMRNHRCE